MRQSELLEYPFVALHSCPRCSFWVEHPPKMLTGNPPESPLKVPLPGKRPPRTVNATCVGWIMGNDATDATPPASDCSRLRESTWTPAARILPTTNHRDVYRGFPWFPGNICWASTVSHPLNYQTGCEKNSPEGPWWVSLFKPQFGPLRRDVDGTMFKGVSKHDQKCNKSGVAQNGGPSFGWQTQTNSNPVLGVPTVPLFRTSQTPL